jgi:hypothetical protein
MEILEERNTTMAPINREPKPLLVRVGTTPDDSTEIDVSTFGGGSFQLPAGSGTTEVTIYARLGTNAYAPAKDDDLTSRSVLKYTGVTALEPIPFPRNLYNYPNVKLVATGGTPTDDVPVFIKG